MRRAPCPLGGAPRLALTCALAAAVCAPIAADAQQRRGSPIAVLLVAGPYVAVNGRPAANGMPIASGDRVTTGPSSSAKLTFYRGGSVQLDANTDPEVYDRSDPGFWQGLYVESREYLRCLTRVVLNTGQVYAEGQSETSCVSHGPETMIPRSQFNLQIVPGQDLLTVVAGEVAVAGVQPTAVRGGTQVTFAEGHIVAQRRVGPEELQQITAWRSQYAFAPPHPAPPRSPYPTPPRQPYPLPHPSTPWPGTGGTPQPPDRGWLPPSRGDGTYHPRPTPPPNDRGGSSPSPSPYPGGDPGWSPLR